MTRKEFSKLKNTLPSLAYFEIEKTPMFVRYKAKKSKANDDAVFTKLKKHYEDRTLKQGLYSSSGSRFYVLLDIDVCKEIASKMPYSPYAFELLKII